MDIPQVCIQFLLVPVANKDLVFREHIVLFYRGHDFVIYATISSLDTSDTTEFKSYDASGKSILTALEH